MKKYHVTKAELATLQALWKSERPLSIKEIPLVSPALNPNTVAASIKNLLKKDMVRVADITYHGTVLTRLFEPAITKEDFFVANLESEEAPIFNIVSNFVKNKYSAEELDALEKIIAEQKKKSK